MFRIPMRRIIFLLRVALGLVFLWFGLLKLFGYNPVYEIIYASFPFLAEGIGFFLLGLFESVIGVALLFNILPTLAHVALIGHLIGTMSVFFISPSTVFSPYFPVLSLAGEFVFKNVVLLIAGFAVLRYNMEHAQKK